MAALLTTLPKATQAADDTPLTIIDSHLHFYDPTRPQGVPWPNPNSKQLYRKVTPADYRAVPQPHPVQGAIIVEASSWLEDNQYILDIAQDDPFIVAVVGNLDPQHEDFSQHVDRFRRNKLYRGVRMRMWDLGKQIEMRDAKLIAGLKLLAKHDLSLDLLTRGTPEMFAHIENLTEFAPDLRIIVDHVGGIRIDGQPVPLPIAEAFEKLAQHDHIYCKYSGFVSHSGIRVGAGKQQTLEYYADFMGMLWNTWDHTKLIYGSDWPVSALASELAFVQQLAYHYAARQGETALKNVFSENAKRVYKYPNRTT